MLTCVLVCCPRTCKAFVNAALVRDVFSGWRMRIYFDQTVPTSMVTDLKRLGVEMIDMTNAGLHNRSVLCLLDVLSNRSVPVS